jgi:hypothetical protein
MVLFKFILVHHTVLENSHNRITIVLSAHNVNHKSFWSGEWLSSWELEYSSEGKEYTLKVHRLISFREMLKPIPTTMKKEISNSI